VRGAARRIVDDHVLDERAQRALRSVVGIVEESWYGDVDAAPGALTEPVREVHEAIATTPRGVRGRLLPRSLVDGLRCRSTRPRRFGGRGEPNDDPSGDARGPGIDGNIDDAAAARH
jgi:hypothetical protein